MHPFDKRPRSESGNGKNAFEIPILMDFVIATISDCGLPEKNELNQA